MVRKFRSFFLLLLIFTITCGLTWAALELAGQSNKSAADAGSSAADMEMASLDTIKPSTSNPDGANKETAIRGKIQKADNDYKRQLAKAKSEVNNSGKVSSGTRELGMAAAHRYKAANNEYAAYWDGKNCASRAQLAREVGESRVKSADMAFNDVSSAKVDAYNSQQSRVRTAQKAYIKDAKTDVSDSDRAAIKADITPRLKKVDSDLSALDDVIASLLKQVQQQIGGGSGFDLTVPSVSGCAQKAKSSVLSAVPTTPSAASNMNVNELNALLGPLKSLLSLVQSMGGNVGGMISDISSL